VSVARKTGPTDSAVVRAFGRFAASGYDRGCFTKGLYHALRQCFGFIAHYDIDGFYEARFGNWEARVDTLAVMSGASEEPLSRRLTDLEEKLRDMVIMLSLGSAACEALAAETEGSRPVRLGRRAVQGRGGGGAPGRDRDREGGSARVRR
jgi:hypothetical protein